jgi:hypothetical protein
MQGDGCPQVKRAIEKGNIDGAKIYAQNAIRKKTEALNYLRLASRLDAVVSRLDTQAKMNMINSSMSQIVRALDKVSFCKPKSWTASLCIMLHHLYLRNLSTAFPCSKQCHWVRKSLTGQLPGTALVSPGLQQPPSL